MSLFDDFNINTLNNPTWDAHFWIWDGKGWVELTAEHFSGWDQTEIDHGVELRRPTFPAKYGHAWFYAGWYQQQVHKHGEMWSA